MTSPLRQPRWIIATTFVVLLAGLFVYLGFWQLDRRRNQIAENDRASSQLAIDPVPLDRLLSDPMLKTTDVEYRKVTIDGTWLPEEEILIRSQVHLGTAGFHVVTPYAFDGGTILVNRGWVPLGMDTTPVQASPSPGSIEGWVHLTQERGRFNPEDAPGHKIVFNRVDIDRIQEQVTQNLSPVYVVQIVEDTGQLPAPLDLPEFSDEGPHLSYAIQWFGFAIVGVVGFVFLVRKKGHDNYGKKSSR